MRFWRSTKKQEYKIAFLQYFGVFIFSNAEISLSAELRHFCDTLICVPTFHTLLRTFGESHCKAITQRGRAYKAVRMIGCSNLKNKGAHISSLDFCII